MRGMRHEDYRHLSLPFVMNIGIERSAIHDSKEQNWHDEWEWQLCESGSGTVLLNGEPKPFRPGEIITVSPNLIHHTGTESDLVYSCLIVRTDFWQQMGLEQLAFKESIRSERLTLRFRALMQLYIHETGPYRTAKLYQGLLAFAIELAENHAVEPKNQRGDSRTLETVKAAVGYIREHYRERITLDALARAVCTDKYTLCRIFKRNMGQTVIEYVNRYRCQLAAERMADGCTVAEAARECGFENLSFFTRCFQKYKGKNPSAYKKKG